MDAVDTILIRSSDAGWTDDVQVQVLSLFIDEIGATERLDSFLRKRMEFEIAAVADNKEGPFIKFEYDQHYFGGNYSHVGQFRYVPAGLCRALDSYERAFQLHTSIDPRHIITRYEDEEFDENGNPWPEK
jgi:hypothetical protein